MKHPKIAARRQFLIFFILLQCMSRPSSSLAAQVSILLEVFGQVSLSLVASLLYNAFWL
jgi:hypothetical protein